MPEFRRRQRLQRRRRPRGGNKDERLAAVLRQGRKLFGEGLPGGPAAGGGPAIIDHNKERLRQRRGSARREA